MSLEQPELGIMENKIDRKNTEIRPKVTIKVKIFLPLKLVYKIFLNLILNVKFLKSLWIKYKYIIQLNLIVTIFVLKLYILNN